MHRLNRPSAAALALLLGCLTLLGVGGCTDPGPARASREAVQALLDRRARALLARDEAGFLGGVDPRARGYRAREAALFRNLAEVPLASWHYRLTAPPRPDTGGRARARVEVGYRLRGYDAAPVRVAQQLLLTERGGRWYVTGTAPGGEGRGQLWDQGPVLVERGPRSLVLGVGRGAADRARLREIGRVADRSVPAVERAWDGRWGRRVVVLVPGTLDGMADLLDAPAAGYQGIAAVTTGESAASGPPGAASADRVVLNPEAYGRLGEVGRRIVLTHEAAHVATRSATSAATPLWLSEGFADWAGYLGESGDARKAAPELTDALARGEVPAHLPTDADFRFDGSADRLAQAYEQSWLACRLIAERWGPQALRGVYRSVGADAAPGDAVERALRLRLGIGRAELVRLWQRYLRERLG
ncbi:hypothetical protein ACFQLX_00955 [Streptomyces polyrhachis]|uniref:Lipoprotein n=1 Tax=Streptomyces polyrhachis TaxID=1282885 RepID=A0ABW2GDE2_9ACTN